VIFDSCQRNGSCFGNQMAPYNIISCYLEKETQLIVTFTAFSFLGILVWYSVTTLLLLMFFCQLY